MRYVENENGVTVEMPFSEDLYITYNCKKEELKNNKGFQDDMRTIHSMIHMRRELEKYGMIKLDSIEEYYKCLSDSIFHMSNGRRKVEERDYNINETKNGYLRQCVFYDDDDKIINDYYDILDDIYDCSNDEDEECCFPFELD